MKITVGKIRGLQQLASPDGIFTICAMDHRGSFLNMINRENPEKVRYEEIVGRKVELCSCLAGSSSAVLLDPIYGAAQCISQGALPSSTGLLVSIEATGYTGERDRRRTRLLDGWSVDKIKRMGASAVKILVYYRPDLGQLARDQLDTVDSVARQCIEHDVPFLVEPISYPVGSEIDNPGEFAARKGDLVIKTADDITGLPVDVLKAEFPAVPGTIRDKSELIALCRRLDETSRVPWVILSAGVDFEVFFQQVEIACQGGASGFLGGRAIWQEAMDIKDTRKRVKYLSTVSTDRMKKLTEIASKYAVPWYKKYGVTLEELAGITENWYQEY
jgi:tagatose 1,6-diphosphate aldolase